MRACREASTCARTHVLTSRAGCPACADRREVRSAFPGSQRTHYAPLDAERGAEPCGGVHRGGCLELGKMYWCAACNDWGQPSGRWATIAPRAADPVNSSPECPECPESGHTTLLSKSGEATLPPRVDTCVSKGSSGSPALERRGATLASWRPVAPHPLKSSGRAT